MSPNPALRVYALLCGLTVLAVLAWQAAAHDAPPRAWVLLGVASVLHVAAVLTLDRFRGREP